MEETDKCSNKTKKGLVIDYSKFQNKFFNNKQISKNNNKENNINIDNKKKADDISKQKNLDQFLNVSGIFNENDSKSISIDNLSQNNRKESFTKIINSQNISKTDRIFYNNFEDINDDPNLLTLNYHDLVLNNEKNMKNFEKNNDLKTTTNASQKHKYVKFLNESCVTERKKNLEENFNNKKLIRKLIPIKYQNKKNNKNSYVEMIKKNNLFDVKRNKRNNYKQKNDSFNLFNEDNHKYNNSISNISVISNIAPSNLTTRDYSSNTSRIINKTNNNNKIKNLLFSNFNKNYNEDLNNKKAHHQKYSSYDKYLNINDLDLLKNKSNNNKNNCINKAKLFSSDLLLYDNNKKDKKKKFKNNYNSSLFNNKNVINNEYENKDKGDEVMLLLDNIKNKYRNKENKYINQQKNMKNEIQILREKLKKLSVNEALYQVEIEKLKRKNDENKNEFTNANSINSNKNLKLNIYNNIFNDSNMTDNNSDKINFGQKLDKIIQSSESRNNNKNFSLNLINNNGFNNNICSLHIPFN